MDFSLRLNRCLESDLHADHHHEDLPRRRRRRRRDPAPREQEDTLELSGAFSEEPQPEPESDAEAHKTVVPHISLGGDPASQVASYWMMLLEESEP